MDSSSRSYWRGSADTRGLCCGGGGHRVLASSTSHSFCPGSFCTFPLAPRIWPLCAWAGLPGDGRKNIHLVAFPCLQGQASCTDRSRESGGNERANIHTTLNF